MIVFLEVLFIWILYVIIGINLYEKREEMLWKFELLENGR